jgi:hypothetical protein
MTQIESRDEKRRRRLSLCDLEPKRTDEEMPTKDERLYGKRAGGCEERLWGSRLIVCLTHHADQLIPFVGKGRGKG